MSEATVTDAEALLRAIVRHPEDDTPRLVYADWLQENGRAEEGEFLRVECGLAAAEPGDPDYPALVDRDEELRLWLTTHEPGPRPTFPAGLTVEGGQMWWEHTHRGFPRFLTFDGYQRGGAKAMRALASAVEKAFDVLPTRWLVVRNITIAQLASLLKQPVLGELSHLTLQLFTNSAEADEAARLLAGCRHLRDLRVLMLAVPITDAGCESLASGAWSELEWFSPDCHEITPTGLHALAATKWFRNLRELKLDDRLPDATFEALARLPAFPCLHTLNLARNHFAESVWQGFTRTRAFPALARLELEDSYMGDGRMVALAEASGFTLRALNLRRCGLGSGAGAALVSAPWVKSLHTLNLSVNALGPAETRAIARSRKFTELRHLDLTWNRFDPAGLAALAANPALRGLRSLRLEGYSTDNRGLMTKHFDHFLTKLNMPELHHLNLSGRPVGAKAARRLTDPRFASLARLGLKGCKLSNTTAATLLASPTLRNLIQLELDDNGLTTVPERLTDPALLPSLASCSLKDNPLIARLARKLRRRPAVRV